MMVVFSVATPAVAKIPWQGSDIALLQRLQQGDQGAASLLFATFEADVNRVVWRSLGADNDHNDLINEIFLYSILPGIAIRQK